MFTRRNVLMVMAAAAVVGVPLDRWGRLPRFAPFARRARLRPKAASGSKAIDPVPISRSPHARRDVADLRSTSMTACATASPICAAPRPFSGQSGEVTAALAAPAP